MIRSTLALAMFFPTLLLAEPNCSRGQFSGPWPEHRIAHYPIDDFRATFNGSDHFGGLDITLTEVGDTIEMDAIAVPGDASAVVAVRAIFILGRALETEAETLVLTQDGTAVFSFAMADIHAIGCRFVWGVDVTSENPIALMRELADSARYAQTGRRAAPAFNGSLLGDTNRALTFINEGLYPAWLFPDLNILP